jgi:hypothetical protein
MTPEERGLMERSLKLSEENNKILRKLQRSARWGIAWGVIKFLIIVVPLVIGYLYLEPYFGPFGKWFQEAQTIIQNGGANMPR